METIFNKDWNDIVFESRNKAYGAYNLRQAYSKHMSVAFLICMAPLGSLLAFSILNTPVSDKVPHTRGPIVILPPEKIDPPKVSERIDASRIKGTKPVVVADTLPVVEKPKTESENTAAQGQSLQTDTTTGASNGNGSGTSGLGTGAGTDSTGLTSIVPEVKPIIDKNKIVLIPDEKAVFSGNIQAYFMDHFNYPKEAKDNGIGGKMRIKFVIETDGTVSNIRFLHKSLGFGLEEEVSRVIASMPAWKPATSKGQVVRSQFTMPFEVTILE